VAAVRPCSTSGPLTLDKVVRPTANSYTPSHFSLPPTWSARRRVGPRDVLRQNWGNLKATLRSPHYTLDARMFRLTLRLSLIGTLLALLSLAFIGGLVLPLLFYFCGLWLLWLLCGCIVTPWPGAARLLGLWALIDLGVLILILVMAKNVSDLAHPGADGADVAILTAYLPVTIPSGFLIPSWARPNLPGALAGTLGQYRVNLINAWLGASVIAAFQCVVLVLIARGGRFLARRSQFVGRASTQRLERP
jgi:hypothetical protein